MHVRGQIGLGNVHEQTIPGRKTTSWQQPESSFPREYSAHEHSPFVSHREEYSHRRKPAQQVGGEVCPGETVSFCVDGEVTF